MEYVWPALPHHAQEKDAHRTEAVALIAKEVRYRIGCADFMPVFTLRQAESDKTGRWPSANWDAEPGEGAESWPRDCAQAFREAVLRNRGKFDIAWAR